MIVQSYPCLADHDGGWITVRKKIVRSIANRIGNRKHKFERKEMSMKRKLPDASVSAVNETEQENVSADDLQLVFKSRRNLVQHGRVQLVEAYGKIAPARVIFHGNHFFERLLFPKFGCSAIFGRRSLIRAPNNADDTAVLLCGKFGFKMSHKLIDGYEKAYNDNIPLVDVVMMGLFIAKDDNFISPEISNVKAIRNGRESYGESAIGYVQVKRTGILYSLICEIAPEHKVTSASYIVELIVNAQKSEIVSVKCFDCVSSLGGCSLASQHQFYNKLLNAGQEMGL
ncbi:Uncharacterized protein APZ42_026642 [Daphnia magna]|uniref:Uncharacterized protein n=1 Tax=Daphnia magna TaxID=35525 RepID=A0A164S1I1_9CRUS|nr:Uncharacterized protein APZ42_026642 [Daphnia magna]